MAIPDEMLSKCDPEWWIGFATGKHSEEIEDSSQHKHNCQHFCRDLYVMVHKNVSTPTLTTTKPTGAQGCILVPSTLSMQPVLQALEKGSSEDHILKGLEKA